MRTWRPKIVQSQGKKTNIGVLAGTMTGFNKNSLVGNTIVTLWVLVYRKPFNPGSD